MSFQIDKCPNFDGSIACPKCGRMMPDLCKDQEDLAEKARKYDEWVASQGVVETTTVIEETSEAETPATTLAPQPAPKPAPRQFPKAQVKAPAKK